MGFIMVKVEITSFGIKNGIDNDTLCSCFKTAIENGYQNEDLSMVMLNYQRGIPI